MGTTLNDIRTGTILKIDPQLQAGYILSDPDGVYVYFDLKDVEKDVGLGVAQEKYAVQYVQETDSSGKPIAKHVTVMPVKGYKMSKY
jgi:hypothetical protein